MFPKKEAKPLDLRTLAITLPRSDADEHKEGDLSAIKKSEQLFGALLALDDTYALEVTVHNVGSGIHFYLAVPRVKADYAIQQLLGLFPEAHVNDAPDYTIFSSGSSVAGGTLGLQFKPYLPLRTYEEAGVDTFSLILSSLGKLNEEGDGAAVQFLVSKETAHTEGSIRSALERLHKGEKLGALLEQGAMSEFGKFGKALFGSSKKESEHEQKFVDEEAVLALRKKAAKQLLSVEARVIVASSDPHRAEELLGSIAGAFSQFSGPMRNEIVLKKARKPDDIAYAYAYRMKEGRSMILNTEELASMFHLPTPEMEIPRVVFHSEKSADTPTLPEEGIIVGDSSFRGESKAVRITDEDRRRHVYMVGQTGTGKSTLIRGMVAQDIERGAGVCLIDPNGDLVDEVLGTIPLHRIDDVIVLDPSELGRPLGLNMLEYDFNHPEQKTFIVNEMQAIFNRLFAQETMGPMFEQYMRNALLLLMEDAANEPATLVEVPRIFTDTAWRNKKLDRIKNPTVVNFWREEAEKAGGDGSLANMTPYITSKFGNFIGNDYIRPIIGQEHSSFDFRRVMDEKKILLVKLPKGRIGDINANLLGMLITGKLLMAALSRDDLAPEAREDFYLYIDEFQNFTTDSIATILSEARKYRLDLTIAHQFLGQLPENIRNAVFGNAGTLIAFRVGSDDGKALEQHMEPNFSSTDLISIENLNAIIRPLVNGHPERAFNMKIRLSDRGNTEVADKLFELSRLTYGATLAEVEEKIAARLR